MCALDNAKSTRFRVPEMQGSRLESEMLKFTCHAANGDISHEECFELTLIRSIVNDTSDFFPHLTILGRGQAKCEQRKITFDQPQFRGAQELDIDPILSEGSALTVSDACSGAVERIDNGDLQSAQQISQNVAA